MKPALFLVPASLLVSSAATAQEAPQQTPPPAADQEAVGDVSDQEVERFALAALLVQQIAQDTAISQEQKQTAMVNALDQAGVEPARFNQIARASQSDPELSQRIEVAAAAHVEAAQQQNQ